MSANFTLVQKEVLRLCIERKTCSIAELSEALSMSIPTVTKIVTDMIASGHLLDEGKIGTKGGRRPNIYGLNPQAGYFIGIAVERQHFMIGICDFKGNLIKYVEDIEFVLEANADSFKKICAKIKDEVALCGIAWSSVLGAGVSLSGRVNPEKGYSLTYFVSDDIQMKDLFEDQLKVPVIIENDSRAMAYGEYMYLGAEADLNMIFINLSWGLGMGMILDGKLYYGKSGFSGELGHFPVLQNEIICRCGKVGCLETGASGSALQRMMMEAIKQGRKSSLVPILEEKGTIRLNDILKAIEEEDMLAIEGVEKIGATLGQGLAGVLNIFNPGLVVIGGRLTVGREYLMLPIKTAVNKFSFSKVSSDTRFRFSELGRKAAAVGDCLLSRDKYIGL